MITGIIVDAAKKVLGDVQQRCTEALKALDQNDYLVVITALSGLEPQIRYVRSRLRDRVKSEKYKDKDKNQKKGGNHDI